MALEGFVVIEELTHDAHTLLQRARRTSDGALVLLKRSSREYPRAAERRRLEVEYHLIHRLQGHGVSEVLALERDGRGPVLVLRDDYADNVSHLPLPLPTFFFDCARGGEGACANSRGTCDSQEHSAGVTRP
jgi:hypothetical protein